MKKSLTFLLAMLILGACIISCGEKSPVADVTTPAITESVVTEPPSDEELKR